MERDTQRPLHGMHWLRIAAVSSVAVGSLLACSGDGDAPVTAATAPPADIALALASSSGSTWVSGGDALVKLSGNVPAGSTVRMTLNGTDVSSALRADAAGAGYRLGLVSGMSLGDHVLAATLTLSGSSAPVASSTVTVKNFPVKGPIFSGPQEQPYFCETANFNLVTGAKLGSPIDADCSVVTRVDYMYRTTATTGAAFKALPSRTALPADVAMTTTSAGKTVPYVVRVETGTVNRAIYEIALLHDPSTEKEPDFDVQSAGWNKRLVYTFGGGCGGGWYRQGNATGGVMVDQLLKLGYAIASSTLNVYSNNCNDATATESILMVKERFIEHYGVPLYTMGTGVSAASYQMHSTVNIYPGIFDGIVPGGSFPDPTGAEQPDAVLLDWYWNGTAPATFTQEQQRAVYGYRVFGAIANRSAAGLRNNPSALFNAVVPVGARYNAVSNPTGARATLPDHNVNIYGRDPLTGFAFRAVDNVGVQYGLSVLNAGGITKTQFLDLNEKIGGFDIDFNPTAQRMVADSRGLRNVYELGRVLDASAGISSTPIIDYRAYTDAQPEGDQHSRYHTFATRDRLIKANGSAANQVVFQEDNRYGLFSFTSPQLMEAIAQMDKWLVALQADTSTDAKRVKVLRAKPAGLVDTCWSPEAVARRIEEPASYDAPNTCNGYYPAFGTARKVAGGPLSNDIIKCQLRPVNLSDYTVQFSAAERLRLAAIFPQGVCDYTKPGVEQTKMKGTWLTF